MQIGGLQKLTLLDFPDRVACTVFLLGCDLRCPFCHNAPLVLKRSADIMTQEAFFEFLDRRRGLLDGVAVSGGEPLIHPELADFLARIRAAGYATKLDTNGTHPEALRALVSAGLLDYVAMDVKNAPEKYDLTTGSQGKLEAVRESAALLMSGALPFEFRTTVVDELHEPGDFDEIGRWLAGAPTYYLQEFVDSGDLLAGGLHAASREKMESCLLKIQKYIPNARLRGQ